MSRFFNGGVAADSITFSMGNAPPDQGPITMAALCRPADVINTSWLLSGRSGTTAVYGMLVDAGVPFVEFDFGSGGPAVTTAAWWWIAVSKASGSVNPRWHIRNVTTGVWSHANDTGTPGDGTGPATSIAVGTNATSSVGSTWRGEIAAVAAWASSLSDGAVEAACTLSAYNLAAASPQWGVLLNQASTATAVTDFTGGGGNQSAISGTAVDGDEPPGWDYSLTAPSNWTYGTDVRIGG